MSDLPRFENVDLTPTWDDVDPAALDFGVGAVEGDADALELNPQPLPPEAEPQAVEVDPEPEPEPQPEAAFEEPEPEPVDDDGAYWEHEEQFDSGDIEAEDLPEDFDALG